MMSVETGADQRPQRDALTSQSARGASSADALRYADAEVRSDQRNARTSTSRQRSVRARAAAGHAATGHAATARMATRAALLSLLFAAPTFLRAQAERGENAWRAGAAFALQGNADSALASFRSARSIAEAVHDSSLLSAALRGEAEVHAVYLGCTDSSLALMRLANGVSISGDRAAGQMLVRNLAQAGKVSEARRVQTALYADVKDEVPRSISRESITYLAGQAAIQRGGGQDAAAFATLTQAREIADRLASGDAVDSNATKSFTRINSANYWVTFELAQLMLHSKSRGVGTVADGKALMNAIADATDSPEEGNERRFSVFRLADRLTINAWRCAMRSEKCTVPTPRKCL